MTHDDLAESDDDDLPISAELIDEDMPCIRCAYNLRGLKPDGRCPECGAPIEETIDYVMQRVLCPACLAPNHPSMAVCLVCGSPLTGAGATANYYRMAPVGARRKKLNYEVEPDPPPAGPFIIRVGFGIFAVIVLAETIWNAWRNPVDSPFPVESIAGRVLLTLGMALIAILPLGLMYSCVRSYRRKRREFLAQHAAFMEKERAADEEEAARKRAGRDEAADEFTDDAEAP